MPPLASVRVVNLGINLPPLLTGARLAQLGADVTKVEPPSGDPMEAATPRLYAESTSGQTVLRLDLKEADDRERLDVLLAGADVLLTSSRPSALRRLRLGPDHLDAHPRLVHVAIVGHAAPEQEVAGHDLTYVAPLGLVAPPELPRTLVADIGGAERAVTAALAALLARDAGREADRYVEVALADAAETFALPWRYELTRPDGILGGALPFYGVYEAADGWIALGALEPHFARGVLGALGLERADADEFRDRFRRRTVAEWVELARRADLPLAPLR